jgi:hypothetical protein
VEVEVVELALLVLVVVASWGVEEVVLMDQS